ncbi:MAG: LacI family transcriptional regulator [Gaiellaceae bacterium]|nr:LacI family transcriptional regulator [Gaiellaceae bacterium]
MVENTLGSRNRTSGSRSLEVRATGGTNVRVVSPPSPEEQCLRTRNPTRLVDVAREAGVHVSTVSRVLNDRDEAAVRPETRERILAAADRLRYRPNALARGLKTATTTTFGMLVPSFRTPVYATIVRGAVAEAWRRGYVVLVAEDDGTVTEEAWEHLVEGGRIDGILVASAEPGGPILQLVEESSVPYVFVNRRKPGSGRNVFMREEDAGRLAAEHLLGLGHVRLCHIAGPLALDTARRRADGFVNAVLAAGVEQPIVVESPFDEAGAHAAMQQLMVLTPRPTGVYSSNLNQAIGALAGARRMGLRVPSDVSLVSYDDDPLADYLEVPLTTIRMPLLELGVAAVGALVDQVEGGAPADLEVGTAPELVVRESTDSPTVTSTLQR